jgi:hypothetical protein
MRSFVEGEAEVAVSRDGPAGAVLQVVSGLAVLWWRRSSRGSRHE